MIKIIGAEQRKDKEAYVYAHMGGGILSSAQQTNNLVCKAVLNLNCVGFNVEYRLAPEHKSPVGQQDFAAVIRFISANADSFGINPNKICIAGDGWICLGASNILVNSNEAHLVQAQFLHSGNVSNEI